MPSSRGELCRSDIICRDRRAENAARGDAVPVATTMRLLRSSRWTVLRSWDRSASHRFPFWFRPSDFRFLPGPSWTER